MIKIFLMFILIMLVLTVSYGFWQLARHINYSFSYESQVKETVCDMVKSENLKKPCESSKQRSK